MYSVIMPKHLREEQQDTDTPAPAASDAISGLHITPQLPSHYTGEAGTRTRDMPRMWLGMIAALSGLHSAWHSHGMAHGMAHGMVVHVCSDIAVADDIHFPRRLARPAPPPLSSSMPLC